MPKTTRTYWNPLSEEHRGDWQPIEGLEGMAEELTLAIDEASDDYTRLRRAPRARADAQLPLPPADNPSMPNQETQIARARPTQGRVLLSP